MSPAPMAHRDLLKREIEGLHEGEEMLILLRYDQVSVHLCPIGKSLIDEMFQTLESMVDLIRRSPDKLTEEKKRVCLGAIKYFLRDMDYVSDDAAGLAGLVDDALIVMLAKEEVKELL